MKGWEAVPDRVLALPKKGKQLAALGKNTDRDTRKDIIRGRLLQNAIQGKDGGAMSAKILGSDKELGKELGMWTPDLQTGSVVIGELPASYDDRVKALLSEEGK